MADQTKSDEIENVVDDALKRAKAQIQQSASGQTLAPARVVLQRHADNGAIDENLLKMAQGLMRQKVSSIEVDVNGWSKGQHCSEIRGAKTLIGKAIERGLLGLMITFGYNESAQQTYAFAYLKPKRKGNQIHFKNNPNDFQKKAADSVLSFQALLNSLGDVGEEDE